MRRLPRSLSEYLQNLRRLTKPQKTLRAYIHKNEFWFFDWS